MKVMTETIVQETLEAKMRDGTVLKADVWRPAGGGKHPVLLIRLPYDKSQGEDLCYAHPSWYARHGYATVVQDVRGRRTARSACSNSSRVCFSSEPLGRTRRSN